MNLITLAIMKSDLQLKDLLMFLAFAGLTTTILFIFYICFKKDIEDNS